VLGHFRWRCRSFPVCSSSRKESSTSMNADYLTSLYEGATHGYVTVSYNNFSSTRSFAVSQLRAAEEFMLARAESENVYFCFALHKAAPQGGRGKSGDVCGVGGLMMDLDLKANEPGVHSKNDLPETIEDVSTLLKEIGIPEPTAIRHSGNGLYADWLFDQVQMFETDQQRDVVKLLSKRLQRIIIQLAKKMRGWSFDNTSDLARVTRMPGTLNHKTNPPKRFAF
jgi:hypothetical protein